MMHRQSDRGLARSSGGVGSGRALNRRQFLGRTALAGAGVAAWPLLGRAAAAAQEIPRAKSGAQVTGTLQVLQGVDYHPDHNAFVRAEIQAYCQLNGWPVDVSEVGSSGQTSAEIAQRLVAAVQAGNPPDLLFGDHPVRQFQYLGTLEPTTDLTEEIIERNGDPTPTMANEVFFEDEWWGVPWFTRCDGWWARTDVFGPAGIDVDALKTFDQRREAALAVSNPDASSWGWGMTINRSGDGSTLVMNALFAHGSTLQDEAGEVVTFNSPESIAALEWLKETYTDPKWAKMLPPGYLSWTDSNNNEAFLAGTVSMTQNAGTMYAKAVFDKVPFADQIAYMPYPVRNSDGAYLDQMGGARLHVIRGTKNMEATSDLIRHLLTEPVQQRIWDISRSYALPAYRNGWKDPLIRDVPNSVRTEPAVWTEGGFTGLAWPGPQSAAVDAIFGGNSFTDMMAEVLQGRAVAEVVADYHNRFVQVFQDFGLPGE